MHSGISVSCSLYRRCFHSSFFHLSPTFWVIICTERIKQQGDETISSMMVDSECMLMSEIPQCFAFYCCPTIFQYCIKPLCPVWFCCFWSTCWCSHQLLHGGSGSTSLEWHFDPLGWWRVSTHPPTLPLTAPWGKWLTALMSWLHLNQASVESCFVLSSYRPLLISVSLSLQWLQCVNSEQSSCFQTSVSPGHVVSKLLF